MNKQPFYHRATILFTATSEYSEKDLQALLRALKTRKIKTILVDTIVVEECDAEPGDPADLI
jgi:ABC-type Zn uptake system ZnuABC Zn-binding protein ZnuA